MLNKRYALLGWLTWRVGKRVAARKARAAVPNVEDRRPNKGLIVSALAGLGALVFFWRRRGDGDSSAE
jgi:hypothetical protein